jgi:hypothetical protein
MAGSGSCDHSIGEIGMTKSSAIMNGNVLVAKMSG